MDLSQLTKEELEKEKLRAEIANLHKPAWKTPTFWFGLISVIGVIGGIVGQHYVSRNEIERTRLETAEMNREARLRTETANDLLAKSKKAVDDAGTATAALRTEYESLWAKIEQARTQDAAAQERLNTSLQKVRDAEDKLRGVGNQIKNVPPVSTVLGGVGGVVILPGGGMPVP